MAVLDHMVGTMVNSTDREQFLELARQHDLRRSLQDNATQGHVASAERKAAAKEAIRSIPESIMRRLKEMRAAVGYSGGVVPRGRRKSQAVARAKPMGTLSALCASAVLGRLAWSG
uniref:Uncharacterized protein n=1 Tax=Alexandrium andersonii TaxID=327968 RepID=A0A7S2BXU4_9DINO